MQISFIKKAASLFVVFLLSTLIAFSQDQLHVKWTFSTKKISDCEYELQFKGVIDEHWHLYSMYLESGDGPIATKITFNPSKDFELVGKTIESTPIKMYDKVFDMNVAYHEKNVTFKQKIRLKTDKAVVITGKYEYETCTDEMCTFPPAEDFEFKLQGTAECLKNVSEPTVKSGSNNDCCYCDSLALLKIWKSIQNGDQSNTTSHTSEKTTTDTSSTSTTAGPIDTSVGDSSIVGKPWWLIFLTGLAWGFAALFTPCVFPLIPMNVSFFLKRSQTKAKGKLNAIIYALSIIIIFVVLGLAISAIWGGGELHTFSTSAGFNLVIFVLLLIFAASFLGGFEIVLPSSFVNKIDKQSDRGGYIGIFFMALTLVVVSFSCTGPMVSNALVAAADAQNTSGAFWALFGFSSGLALPFGVFAFFPSMLTSMPKSGGWLNSVKVVLGFLELALALKFASNVDLVYQLGILTREVFITLWVVIFALTTIYLMGGFKTSHDSDVNYLSVTRIFFIVIFFSVTIYILPGLWGAPLKLLSGVLPPADYSESPHGFGGSSSTHQISANADPEFAPYMEVTKSGISFFKNDYDKALAYAKKVGKPLMVDFTGHACANCRKTEDYVWPDSEVTKRLQNNVVLVSLFVDDKRELPEKEHMKVFWYGKDRTITTIGDKFKYLEETKYKQLAQPLYVLLDHNENLLNPPRAYNPSIPEYVKWLDEGTAAFKARKK